MKKAGLCRLFGLLKQMLTSRPELALPLEQKRLQERKRLRERQQVQQPEQLVFDRKRSEQKPKGQR